MYMCTEMGLGQFQWDVLQPFVHFLYRAYSYIMYSGQSQACLEYFELTVPCRLLLLYPYRLADWDFPSHVGCYALKLTFFYLAQQRVHFRLQKFVRSIYHVTNELCYNRR